jgi:hypothetical protein
MLLKQQQFFQDRKVYRLGKEMVKACLLAEQTVCFISPTRYGNQQGVREASLSA